MRRVKLFEHVRFKLTVETDGLDDLLALFVARLLHEVGDLRLVKLGELAIGNAEPRRRDVGHERLDRCEVHDAIGLDTRADLATEHPTKEGVTTGVDTDDLPTSVDLG